MSEKKNILLLDHREQEELLEKYGYDLMEICNDFWGKKSPYQSIR